MEYLSKKEIRQKIHSLENNLTKSQRIEYSHIIFDQIENSDYFIKSSIIALYWSIKNEVITHDFILKWYTKKTIILPCINKENIEFKVFTGLKNLKTGIYYEIPEPQGNIVNKNEINLIVVPGLAFDKNKNRLGRGKGYYDRFLKDINIPKIGVCFSYQLFGYLPLTSNDVKMDMIITEKEIIS